MRQNQETKNALKLLKDIHTNNKKLLQLKKVFDKYRNKCDWKKPFIGICKDSNEQLWLAAACIYYHGTDIQYYARYGVKTPGYQAW